MTRPNGRLARIRPPKGLTAFIGLCEMAGGLGLVIPQATGVLPMLTPVAAAA